MNAPESNEKAAARPRIWLRRLLACTAFIAAILLLPLFWLAYREWRIRSELAVVLAELDQTDPGWRAEDLISNRPPLPDDQNAWKVAQRAIGARPRNAFSKPFFYSESHTSLLGDNPARLLHQAIVQEYAAELARCDRSLELAQALAGLTAGRLTDDDYPLGWITTDLPVWVEGQRARNLCNLLMYSLRMQAHQGNAAAGADTIKQMLALIHVCSDSNNFFSDFVALSLTSAAVSSLERLLANTELSDSQLDDLRKALTHLDDPNRLATTLRRERAACDRMFTAFADGRLANYDRAMAATYASNVDVGLFGWKTGWDRLDAILNQWNPRRRHGSIEAERLAHLHAYTHLIKICRLPPEERIAAAITPHHEATQFRSRLCDWLEPPNTTRLIDRDLARMSQVRCALTAIAAERYRLRHGRWPTETAELTDFGSRNALLDPCAGQPHRIEPWNEGIVIYSVGPYRSNTGDPETFSVRDRPGIRLWHPNLRRQPPLAQAEENDAKSEQTAESKP